MAEDFENLMEELAKATQQRNSPNIGELLQAYLPLVDAGLEISDELLDKYGPKLADYMDKLRSFAADQDVKTFKQYMEGGMGESAAISLMIANKQSQAKIAESFRK